MRPLVSVIVPVYNVEKYLAKCLDSILSQTLMNIEVIAVNDGSTDNSGSVLDAYAARDCRLKVIHKEHEGVSEARNEALKHVQGEFVGFVDSDDWIDNEMYEIMYKTAVDKNIDIVMCGYIREFADHSRVKVMDLQDGTIIKGKDVHEKFIRRLIGPISDEPYITENLDMHSTLWNKLYRSHIINNLTFYSLKEIGSCEDLLFNLSAFSKANVITFINRPYYHYRKTSSISVTNRYRPDLVKQRDRLIYYIRRFIDENKCTSVFQEALNNRICLGVLGLGLNIAATENKITCRKKIRQIKDMLSNPSISEAFGTFRSDVFPFHWKLFYRFAKSKSAIGFYFMIRAIKVLIFIAR